MPVVCARNSLLLVMRHSSTLDPICFAVAMRYIPYGIVDKLYLVLYSPIKLCILFFFYNDIGQSCYSLPVCMKFTPLGVEAFKSPRPLIDDIFCCGYDVTSSVYGSSL